MTAIINTYNYCNLQFVLLFRCLTRVKLFKFVYSFHKQRFQNVLRLSKWLLFILRFSATKFDSL